MPYWRSVLGWVALVPLLIAILGKDRNGSSLRLQSATVLGYACGIIWYLGNCYWIYQTMYLYGGLPKPAAAGILLLFALYLGLYHALFAWLLTLLRRSRLDIAGALLLSPFVWVAVELARARITGFPWDLLGYSQVDNLLVTRIAPVAGVMTISFLLTTFSASFAGLILLGRRAAAPFAALALLAAILYFYGAGAARVAAGSTYAVLMQENLSVGATAREVQPLSAPDELSVFSAMSLHPGFAGKLTLPADAQTALVVWPEAPSHFRSDDPYLGEQLGKLARAADTVLIAGDIGIDLDRAAPKGYYEYDSASMFDRQGTPGGRYDKIHLVPWGEYVPFKHVFAFAEKLTEGVGDMDPGHSRSIFKTAGRSYGVFICYESIFGDEVREFAKNGAEVLVNISDDGWYGDTSAPWQHLNMARMRAIENDRYLLRSTNTGITTVIAPDGTIRDEAPRHVRGAFAFPFAYETHQTIYTRYGDWFAWLCVLVTATGLALSLRPRVD